MCVSNKNAALAHQELLIVMVAAMAYMKPHMLGQWMQAVSLQHNGNQFADFSDFSISQM
jgi:hypothetical protein